MKTNRMLFWMSMSFLVACGADPNDEYASTAKARQALKPLAPGAPFDGSLNKFLTSTTDAEWNNGYANNFRSYLKKGSDIYAFVRQKTDGDAASVSFTGKICDPENYTPPTGYVTFLDTDSNSGSALKVFDCGSPSTPKDHDTFFNVGTKVEIHNLSDVNYGYLRIDDAAMVPGSSRHAWYNIYGIIGTNGASNYDPLEYQGSGYLCNGNSAKPNWTMMISGRLDYSGGTWNTIGNWGEDLLTSTSDANQKYSFSCKLATTDCIIADTVPALMDATPSTGQDCAYKVCVGVSNCNDGCKSGGEGGTDCGGTSTCGICAAGKDCTVNSDCYSNNCQSHVCVGNVGDPCTQNSDCGSAHCTATYSTVDGFTVTSNKICTAAHCHDDTLNANANDHETDRIAIGGGHYIDCGGDTASPSSGCIDCPNGKYVAPYFQDSCASGHSTNGYCRHPLCDNGVAPFTSFTADWDKQVNSYGTALNSSTGSYDEDNNDCDNDDPGQVAAVNAGDYACGWCTSKRIMGQYLPASIFNNYHGECHSGIQEVYPNTNPKTYKCYGF